MATAPETTRFFCLFHSPAHAQAAVQALQQLGLSEAALTTLDGTDAGAGRLEDAGVPARDTAHLAEGLRRGGVLVSLLAPEDRTGAIERIFHRYTADKIDETAIPDTAPNAYAAPVPSDVTATEARALVVPVVAEELSVGKRAVDRGGVRVFQRTVETPVQEDVTLHNERVVLAYREVDRPATEADLRAGAQQIELVETAEVPVVEKRARVVEEVHVGKVASDHVAVVQDTVRHTEVEVEPVQRAFDPSVDR